MVASLVLTFESPKVDSLILKTDKLDKIDEYVSGHYACEADIMNSKDFSKKIIRHYRENSENLNEFDFGIVKILCIYNKKDNLEFEYLDPLYDNDIYQEIAGKNIFGISEKKYLKNRKRIGEKELVYNNK